MAVENINKELVEKKLSTHQFLENNESEKNYLNFKMTEVSNGLNLT